MRGGEQVDFDYEQDGGEVLRPEDYRHDPPVLSQFLCIRNEIDDRTMSEMLRDNLVERLYTHHGDHGVSIVWLYLNYILLLMSKF